MANLLGLHPEIRRRAEAMLQRLRREGYSGTITSAYRSVKEQQRLYKLHLAFPESYPFPVARPGCSTHNYGLAIDLITDLPEGNREAFADFFGLVWAGPQDPVHYDPFGFSAWRAILHSNQLC